MTARTEAVLAAAFEKVDVGLLLIDGRQPDQPIVRVNRAFELITLYARDEAVGRNCRFLQGPDSDPETVDQMRAAVAARMPFRAELVNYRKDGTSFWN
jgi:PAS domain S-box-containing protein